MGNNQPKYKVLEWREMFSQKLSRYFSNFQRELEILENMENRHEIKRQFTQILAIAEGRYLLAIMEQSSADILRTTRDCEAMMGRLGLREENYLPFTENLNEVMRRTIKDYQAQVFSDFWDGFLPMLLKCLNVIVLVLMIL